MDMVLWMIPLAFMLDLVLGDPEYRLHPIRVIGNRIVSPLENRLRAGGLTGRNGGVVLVVITACICLGFMFAVNRLLKPNPILYLTFNIYILYSCIAVKDMKIHVERVIGFLEENDLENARKSLQMVVGRQTDQLDDEGISRACVETLAENLSDGIVAPLFYAMIGGAPLALLYKAVNTMDSMVGYKNDRYKDFGYYPAKLDDVLNWIPARLTWLILLLNGFRYSKQMKSSIKIAVKDRKNHSSPNAGFPEAAMAGILQVRLGGPNLYHGEVIEKPYINENGEPAEIDDIGRAWKLVFSSAVLSVILFILLRMVFRMIISV